MPHKELSPSELLEIIQEGGKVVRKSDPSVIPEGFVQIMSQMKELIDSHKQVADQQRQLMIQVIGRLTQALENFKGENLNLKPLESLVAQLTTIQHVEKSTYEFHVERNSRGFMTGMIAKPSTPVIN